MEVRCYILISNISGSVKVAPLQILQFPVILPHKFQDAEKFNLQFSDFSEITETADKLRWLRYQKGLRQRDVADYAGIQIGAIKLNQTLEVVDSFNERIAPQYYTELHPKVAEITKLSNRDLQKGKGFHTVFNSFCDWCGDDFVFLVWGTEDLRILRKNMDLHNIDTSFMPPCFNLQNIFVDQVTHDTKQYALANALAIVGEVAFDSHDALNDARSTALLCTHLDLIRGLNEYKETVENRNGIVESYEFEEPYADIGDALSDDYVVSFECPHCGEIVWGENWIRKTGTNLLSLSQCSDGQEYLISLKFRPIAENKVVVKRLVYALTDELRTDYQQCMKQAAAWSKYVIPAYSF